MTKEKETTACVSIHQIGQICKSVDQKVGSELSGIFSQERTRKKARDYVDGLSNPYLENKTTWGIAEYARYENPGRLQSLIGENKWSWKDAWTRIAIMGGKLATASAGDDPMGVGILFDETADVMRGGKTCGVAYQYAGCAGGVENCTNWVMATITGGAVKTWAAADLFLPEKEWFTGKGDKGAARRKAAGVPGWVRFSSKPRIALKQLRRLRKTLRKNGIKLRHGGGDEVYGRFDELLKDHEKHSEAYSYFIPRDKRVEIRKGHRVRVDSLLELADGHWEKRPSRNGVKGPLDYEWAMIGLSSGRRSLLLRRPLPSERRRLREEAEARRNAESRKSGEEESQTSGNGAGESGRDRVREEMITFCLCYVPLRSPIAPTMDNLVSLTGIRWSAEEANETGKGPIGWDDNHFRKWDSVNKHTALTGIAMLKSNMILHDLESLRKGELEISASYPGQQEPSQSDSTGNPPSSGQDYRDEDLMVPLGDAAVPLSRDDSIPADIGFIKLSRNEVLRLREIALSGMSESEMAFHLRWSKWRRRHQAIARWHQRIARMKAMDEPGDQSSPGVPATDSDARPGRHASTARQAA